MKAYIIRFAAILLFSLISCEKIIIEPVSGPNGHGKLYSIKGHAQKGPFIVGTDVTVSELNDKLFPTGRVFFSTILDDKGRFELPGVVLESPFIQIKVRGRYFSETGGYVPTEELTLYSLADITKGETINVNILTHLEKERVEYLVQKNDHTFESAKTKAQEEILNVFEWGSLSVDESVQLDLSEDNTGGAVLLALSAVFENIEFITRLETIVGFKSDFAEDGKLDSESIQNRLLTAADMLNTEIVRTNMETKYEATIGDFESIVFEFVENSSYVNLFDAIMPKTYQGLTNIFRTKETTFDPNKDYGFIILPKPDGVIAWETSRYISFTIKFAGNSTYPENSPNDFIMTVTSDFNLNKAVSSISPCLPEHQGLCYEVSGVGGLQDIWNGGTWDPNGQTPVIRPVTILGTGSLTFSINMDIDHIFYPTFHEITW